ncbi:MAG: 30S ribosomal protein S8 [Candidatus Aerophobetes bacterium]|nr:30S ribosomal protein S8 [Candidatus Aerophobetes bacterium]
MSDPVADLLTRIRNANLVFKNKVEIPASNLKRKIVSIFKKEGFIKGYVIEREQKKNLLVYLKYGDKGERVITHLERVSKPGRRVYVKKDKIPNLLGHLGVCILSTPKGIVTGKEARKLGVGGEVLCYIW